MKFLIVDDSRLLLATVVVSLREQGIDIVGATPSEPGLYGNHEGTQKTAALEADVIFLDHNMPGRNGEQWLERCRQAKVDFSQKRIIGISTEPQPYLTEQIEGKADVIINKVLEINSASVGSAT